MDHHVRRARILDSRAHRNQEVGEVDDLGLAGGVVDDGRSPSAHGRHHEILGRAHALEIEDDLGADQAVGRARVEVAVVYLELDAEGLEAGDMHVELARADLAPSRHRDDRTSETRDERSEDRDRGAHLGNELVGRLVGVDSARVYGEGMGALLTRHGRTDGREHVAHDVDIGDERHVADARLSRRHHAGGHELENRVLGAADLHRPRDGTPAVDDDQLT